MTNIFRQLSDEHEEVRKLFDTLEEEDRNRSEIFEELRRSLVAHARGEEAEFYPYVRELDREIASKIEDALQEHQEIEKVINQLQKVLNDDAKFAGLLEELRDNVEHHVDEEEGEIFVLIEQHMSEEELEELNERYLEAKRAAMESIAPDVGAGYESDSVAGRPTMNNDEIEEDLRNKGV